MIAYFDHAYFCESEYYYEWQLQEGDSEKIYVEISK